MRCCGILVSFDTCERFEIQKCFIFGFYHTSLRGCKSLLSIGGDNLLFYPNFARFSTLGEMNLDHNFFWVSKLSEEQKKLIFTNNGTLFFPEFKWRPALRCTPESNYWKGCRCRPYSNYWGIMSNYWEGDIPHPPGFRHPCLSGSTPQRARFLVCCMNCQHLGNYAIVILILIFYQVALAIKDCVGTFWSSSQVATCPPLT